MTYPNYLSDIQRTPPEGYSPTERLCEVRSSGSFSLPGGRPRLLAQLWTGQCVGDDPVWVFVPEVHLVGLHPDTAK